MKICSGDAHYFGRGLSHKIILMITLVLIVAIKSKVISGKVVSSSWIYWMNSLISTSKTVCSDTQKTHIAGSTVLVGDLGYTLQIVLLQRKREANGMANSWSIYHIIFSVIYSCAFRFLFYGFLKACFVLEIFLENGWHCWCEVCKVFLFLNGFGRKDFFPIQLSFCLYSGIIGEHLTMLTFSCLWWND